jgi:hypothetical protein
MAHSVTPSITRSEWRWVLCWTAVALLVVNVPYLLGLALSTPDMEFGGAVYAVEDVNSYFAKMRQGERGAWLFRIPYTAEEHPGTIIYLFYLLLGKVPAVTGLSIEWTFHLARLACGATFLHVVYRFVARFSPHRAVRRIAFLLVAFSGGMGWLMILTGQPGWLGMLSIDLILPEGYGFLTLYSSPHLALAVAALLWGMERIESGSTNHHVRPVLSGAAALLVVALIGAFYLLVPYTVLGIHWAIAALRRRRPDWRALWLIFVSGLPSAMVIGYDYAYFAFEPTYRSWAAQNLIRSPHPLHYVAGYLIVGTLALLGGWWAVRRRRGVLQLPLIWVAIVPLLLYIPFNMQRRLIIGAQVPLCTLASLGWVHCVALPVGRSRAVRWLSRRPRYSRGGMRRFLTMVLIVFTTLTNLLLILGNCVEVAGRKRPIFHARAELDALDWLRANTAPEDTVLCAYETGNYLPARAGNRVMLGLGTETLDAERKRTEVRRFFDAGERDAWRRDILRQYRIAYVLLGPHERSLGAFDPGDAPYLTEVYANDTYEIYRVEVEP